MSPMITKKLFTTVAIILPIMLCSCASSTVTERNIRMELSRAKRMIQTDRDKMVKLKDKKVNKRGFFYVIDNSGLVVYHPQELLIGRNFNNYWFIQAILKNRSGCLSYLVGTQEHYIFFDNINRSQILCYSVSAADMEGPLDKCARVSPEDVQTGDEAEGGAEPRIESQGETDGSSESK